MHLLTKNTCIFKKTSDHNWHRFKKEKKKKKIILIFQPGTPHSDPISNTLQEYFPDLHDVHGILLTCAEQESVLRAAHRSVLRSLNLVG